MVDEAPLFRFGGSHEMIAIESSLNLLVRAPAVPGVDFVEAALRLDDVFRVTLDVRGDALESARRLVHEDAGVR